MNYNLEIELENPKLNIGYYSVLDFCVDWCLNDTALEVNF